MQRNIFLGLLLVCFNMSGYCKSDASTKKIIGIIEKVNTCWQDSHQKTSSSFWDNAVYHTGNMEVVKLTGNEKFRLYSEKWAINNEWKGAKGDNPVNWKYKYGESPDHVLFGDWQICFQTYADLYVLSPDTLKIARARQVMEFQMKTLKNDYWWWVDGLYMVMPVMTKLYKITGNPLYISKLNDYFNCAVSIMYDQETKLFFRDAKYIYPKHKSINGMKDFWARGNGWAFAALAKVLDELPKDCQYYPTFEKYYIDMANTLIKYQQKEGYWTRSMLDPLHAPGYESSGTALFTYGLLWGINNGQLKGKIYTTTAIKGWKYLSNIALQSDGKIGYVQPIGEKAIPGQIVDAGSTANFGVGAFLLAASEMVRYTKQNPRYRDLD